MNQSEQCHEIKNCEGLYIDGFSAFKQKTEDHRCSFILTHYHADHYTGLPKNNKYKGPALIHCTPVTGALLRQVHGVTSDLIVEHPYGITWTHTHCNVIDTQLATVTSEAAAAPYSTHTAAVTEITFYDANHCPGAAIIIARLPNSDGKCHLHTGDMRYHEKFMEYPLLKDAVQNKKIDRLYLDTTYGHPKHTFPTQQTSVNFIASQVTDLLEPNQLPEQTKGPPKQSIATISPHDPSHDQYKTLVLLSCYSIGKEKVLWAAATQSNQMVYVNDAKFKKLQCITGHTHIDPSSGLLDLCTQDPTQSDLHVIPMGTAGKMFPYFIPNYQGCAKYANKCNNGYTRVVAFIPTGWAEASNYNKKNSVSKQDVTVLSAEQISSVINVEIRLVAYSEHSSFGELRSFVEFLRPKKIIPTVFSNEKDRIAIGKRFKDLVDSYGVKVAFVNSMSVLNRKRKVLCDAEIIEINTKKEAKSSYTESKPKSTQEDIIHSKHAKLSSTKSLGSMSVLNRKRKSSCKVEIIEIDTIEETKLSCTESKARSTDENNAHLEHVNSSSTHIVGSSTVDDAKVAILVSMGFDARSCHESLRKSFGDIDRAIERLLNHRDKPTPILNKGPCTKSATTITNFFSRKSI